MKALKTKKPSASETIKTEVVCPNDTNPMGILQGGRLVQWMDIAAAVTAQTHAEKICVTASINEINFKYPAKVGDIVIIHAKITRAFSTSMEIFVEAYAKQVLSDKKHLISTSYFTFVALNDEAATTAVFGVKPVSKKEIEKFDSALLRRKKSNG